MQPVAELPINILSTAIDSGNVIVQFVLSSTNLYLVLQLYINNIILMLL